MTTQHAWEPHYGLCAYQAHDPVELAAALETVRRRVCAYAGPTCDCKYGVGQSLIGDQAPARSGSEQSGCPELRQVIHWLLHRQPDEPSEVERRVLAQCDLIEVDGRGKAVELVSRAIAEQFRAAVRGPSGVRVVDGGEH